MRKNMRHTPSAFSKALLIFLIFIYIFAFSIPHAPACESHDCPICILRSLGQLLWIPLLLAHVIARPDSERMLAYARRQDHAARAESPIDRFDKLSD